MVTLWDTPKVFRVMKLKLFQTFPVFQKKRLYFSEVFGKKLKTTVFIVSLKIDENSPLKRLLNINVDRKFLWKMDRCAYWKRIQKCDFAVSENSIVKNGILIVEPSFWHKVLTFYDKKWTKSDSRDTNNHSSLRKKGQPL